MHNPMHYRTPIQKCCHKLAWRAVVGVLLLLTSVLSSSHPSLAQDPDDDPAAMSIEAAQRAADDLIAQMSVADKIGQLFVVTFAGTNVGLESDIANLVINYRVGGVMIQPDNLDPAQASSIEEIVLLNHQLQRWAALDALTVPAEPSVAATAPPTATLEVSATLTTQAISPPAVTPSTTAPAQPVVAGHAGKRRQAGNGVL